MALSRQRLLKGEVVAEQLRRLAGLEREVVVEAVPGDVEGLRWRTRTRFARLPDGGTAMRKHRSHELVAVDDCLIATPGASEPATVEVVEAAGGATSSEWQGTGSGRCTPVRRGCWSRPC